VQISASANNESDFSFTWTTPNASTVTLTQIGPYAGVPAGTFTPGATYVINLQLDTGSVIGYKKVSDTAQVLVTAIMQSSNIAMQRKAPSHLLLAKLVPLVLRFG
jgi:hypothetical protein